MNDLELLYRLSWKSENACKELINSEYFIPRESQFEFGKNCYVFTKIFELGYYFEIHENDQVISTLYINKVGLSSPVRFIPIN